MEIWKSHHAPQKYGHPDNWMNAYECHFVITPDKWPRILRKKYQTMKTQTPFIQGHHQIFFVNSSNKNWPYTNWNWTSNSLKNKHGCLGLFNIDSTTIFFPKKSSGKLPKMHAESVYNTSSLSTVSRLFEFACTSCPKMLRLPGHLASNNPYKYKSSDAFENWKPTKSSTERDNVHSGNSRIQEAGSGFERGSNQKKTNPWGGQTQWDLQHTAHLFVWFFPLTSNMGP